MDGPYPAQVVTYVCTNYEPFAELGSLLLLNHR